MNDDDFQKRLLGIFRVEASEHVAALSAGLEQLASGGAANLAGELERIFREAHSLKGAARAVGAHEIERVCQELESRFSAMRRSGTVPARALMDALDAALNLLERLAGEGTTAPADVDRVIGALRTAAEPGPATAAESPGGPPEIESGLPESAEASAGSFESALRRIDTTRVSIEELDTLFRLVEETYSACLAQDAMLNQLREMRDHLARQRAELSLSHRGGSAAAPGAHGEGNGNAGPADFAAARGALDAPLALAESECCEAIRHATAHYRQLRASVNGLLENVKRLQMLPLNTVLDPLPRMARELGRERGKEVRLEVRGGEVRVDKRILDNLGDPLVHLLRNAVDHGLEAPQDRERAGKSPIAALIISVEPYETGRVELRIVDDGCGVDIREVKRRAAKSGAISEEEAASMTEEQALGLIFRSGLTTSPIVTDLSGRGLGLAIVREKVEALEGSVRCFTEPGKGTTFQILLPVNLATTRVVDVRAGHDRFFIPSSYIVRVLRIPRDSLRTVTGRAMLNFNGESIPAATLSDILRLPNGPAPAAPSVYLSIVVLRAAERSAAIVIDAIGAEQETIVKNLGPQLVRVRNVAGASIGAAGAVTIVLNAADLVVGAIEGPSDAGASRRAETAEAVPVRVLVVDDSVTSRSLLRDIFIGAGYKVETAVDGVDAFTKLRESEVDLLVSDVDMPRLNGFDLVRKVRAEAKFAELPIILVTSLDSREDRERGIEVGANAYIVKTRFDQSNLLEVAGRFV